MIRTWVELAVGTLVPCSGRSGSRASVSVPQPAACRYNRANKAACFVQVAFANLDGYIKRLAHGATWRFCRAGLYAAGESAGLALGGAGRQFHLRTGWSGLRWSLIPDTALARARSPRALRSC